VKDWSGPVYGLVIVNVSMIGSLVFAANDWGFARRLQIAFVAYASSFS